ncbi:MAG TPA: FAD-dependent oxidoreductase, partial [Burkholderiales bacterium]|nr:FAD-dependent oxidoreductase [Burkholderiales bacterium]
MLRLTEVKLPLEHTESELADAIVKRLQIDPRELVRYTIFRRAVDARKRSAIGFTYTLDIEVTNEAAVVARAGGHAHLGYAPEMAYRFVARAPQHLSSRPVVIGTGPCGLFAALILAQTGFRPIVLERGKAVRERTHDTWGLWRKSILDPESNVQFGEGGAGTFSDGKLYSQIKDPRFLGRKVLTEFVKAGAPAEILYVSKPHIGTFRLVGMVERMRETIHELGGEIRFKSRVTDIEIDETDSGQQQVLGVVLENGERIATDHLVLAVGHSA